MAIRQRVSGLRIDGAKMRLTLRTLLAYRDRVLSDTDTESLRNRIAQTPRAANLLQRIDSIMQRSNLLPPKLKAEGLLEDANSVAAYLDDSMPVEQIAEFERLCIEGPDAHLAEVGHCHKLLADAMSAEVLIPPSLKETVIGLDSAECRQALIDRLAIGKSRRLTEAEKGDDLIVRNDRPHAIAGTHSGLSASSEQRQSLLRSASLPPQTPNSQSTGLDLERPASSSTAPEYLTGSPPINLYIPAAIIGLSLAMVWLVFQSIGSIDNLWQMYTATEFASRSPGEVDSSEDAKAKRAAELINRATNQNGQLANKEIKENPASPSRPNDADVEPKAELDRTDVPEVTVGPEESNNAEQVEKQPAPVIETRPEATPPSKPTPSDPPTADKNRRPIAWLPNSPEESKAVLLARGISAGGQIALRRLKPTEAIEDHTELLVPPTMRSTLDMAGHCLWTACGATRMILARSPQGAELRTLFCRALVRSGPIGNRITLQTPTGMATIKFPDASCVVAIELSYRPLAVGAITDVYRPVLIVSPIEGDVDVEYQTLTESASTSLRLAAGEGLALVNNQPKQFTRTQNPAWYKTSSDRRLDAVAAEDFHQILSQSAPAIDLLASAVQEKRPETAALAIQTSMLLGDWMPFVDIALNAETMSSHWTRTLSLAEQILAADPSEVRALKEYWKAISPNRAAEMFMLINGNSEMTGNDLLAGMVGYLESPYLDQRVLAIHQLQRLTGKQLGFQPAGRSSASVREWKREVNAGRIAIQPLQEPIWEAAVR